MVAKKTKNIISKKVVSKKKLSRSSNKKVFGGVIAGIGDYLNIEVVVLRAIPFLLTLLTYLFFGLNWAAIFVLAIVFIYVICWIWIPEE